MSHALSRSLLVLVGGLAAGLGNGGVALAGCASGNVAATALLSDPACQANASGGPGATAVGAGAFTSSNFNTAVGGAANANGSDSTAVGGQASAITAGATAIGRASTANGSTDGDTAVGFFSTAQGVGSDAALALGSFATATGGGATAVGNDTRANGAGAVALGGDDPTAGGTQAIGAATTAVGAGAQSTAANATSLGNKASATGINSTVVGMLAGASGTGASAFGTGSTANFANSTAIGSGAATTRANQMALGTASNTYTMAGINSAASAAAQTGIVRFATADSNGNMAVSAFGPNDIAAINATNATQSGQIASLDGRVSALENASGPAFDKAYEGTAIAIAMSGGGLPSDKNYAVSINWGTFEGQNGFAGSAAARINENLYVQGGLGVGASEGTVGGRLGMTLAW